MNGVELIWQFIACLLVLSMQAGFLLLEAGRVSSKNSVNVAQKNVTDFVISTFCFITIGSFIMFGLSAPLSLATAEGHSSSQINSLQFLYQLGFCSAAVTIASGLVAERMEFRGYLVLVIVMSAFAYPLVGMFAWGNLYNDNSDAWLANLGFIDFAGGTVVHVFGATCGLVASKLLGPRISCLTKDGRILESRSGNSIYIMLGGLILLCGWFGFNAGSIAVDNSALPIVVINTFIAASAGGFAGMFAGLANRKGVLKPSDSINGMLGGLVACTAGVHLMQGFDSVVVGVCGGFIAIFGAEFVRNVMAIDDPLDAFAVHGLAGIFGTLAVVFLIEPGVSAAATRWVQASFQLTGIVTVMSFAAIVTYVPLKILSKLKILRVSAEAEVNGLNFSEHGEMLDLDELEKSIFNQLNTEGVPYAEGAQKSDEGNSLLSKSLADVISARALGAKSAQEQQQRFNQVLSDRNGLGWETDSELIIRSVQNEKGDPEDFILTSLLERHFLECFDIANGMRNHIHHCIENRLPTDSFESRLRGTSEANAHRVFLVTCRPQFSSAGVFFGYAGTIREITQQLQSARDEYMSRRKHTVSGLWNQQALIDKLNLMLVNASTLNSSVCSISVDLGKLFPDGVNEHSYATNIKELGALARLSLRSGERIFHTDDTRFELLVDGLPVEKASRIAANVSQRIFGELENTELDLPPGAILQIGIGFSLYPQDAVTSELLREMSYQAMKAASLEPQSTIMAFETELEKKTRAVVKRKSELRLALDNREFILFYQPQICTHTESLIGFEALVRWQHPIQGIIAPGHFIADVEKYDLMDELGKQVLDQSCRFVEQQIKSLGWSDLTMSVNVSPTQIQKPLFEKNILEIINQYSLDAGIIEIELTEEAYINDFDSLRVKLDNLGRQGIKLALDDFGTGNTSLLYLQQLPASKLKIDKSFIDAITENEQAASVAKAIIELGKTLGMNVIAEGVETLEQVEILREWNCDQIQGYYFSKPLNETDASVFLQNKMQDRVSEAKSNADKAA